MMNMKYFILLCLTFYTPTVDSITEEQIKDLWNNMKTGQNNYIVYENFLKYYEDVLEEDRMEFFVIITMFRTDCTCKVLSMNFEKFTEAAKDGHIPISQSLLAFRLLFDQMAPAQHKDYVTWDNIKAHYGDEVYGDLEEKGVLAEVEKFGKKYDGEWRMDFGGLKRAVNIGYLQLITSNKMLQQVDR
ncbi:uncharacterized protein LOC126847905 [Adelges cooleyi]|uniref:uncharacterized protein LOC126847905 n=1 Tax=Adelges cooleyi TaxID=133065 RepID=UPI002180944E|nr:uncharacterized protein LOC126847905 [Adelges cooleyi]